MRVNYIAKSMYTRNFKKLDALSCLVYQNQQDFSIYYHSIHHISTQQFYNNKPSSIGLKRYNEYRNDLYIHQRQNITLKTVIFGGATFLVLKKLIALRFVNYIGLKRFYRYYYRLTSIYLQNQPKHKRQKVLKLITKLFRLQLNASTKFPTILSSVKFIDKTFTNIFMVPIMGYKKLMTFGIKAIIHAQKERINNDKLLRSPDIWEGPIMLKNDEILPFINIFLISRYLLPKIPDIHGIFLITFVKTNNDFIKSIHIDDHILEYHRIKDVQLKNEMRDLLRK